MREFQFPWEMYLWGSFLKTKSPRGINGRGFITGVYPLRKLVLHFFFQIYFKNALTWHRSEVHNLGQLFGPLCCRMFLRQSYPDFNCMSALAQILSETLVAAVTRSQSICKYNNNVCWDSDSLVAVAFIMGCIKTISFMGNEDLTLFLSTS